MDVKITLSKGPSERPTSPDIPTPSLYLGFAIVVSVASILHKKDQLFRTYTSENSCPSVSGRNREQGRLEMRVYEHKV